MGEGVRSEGKQKHRAGFREDAHDILTEGQRSLFIVVVDADSVVS